MDKYICKVCAYVYDPNVGDPDEGVPPGTPFTELPKEWVCPLCGVNKDHYERLTPEEAEKFIHDGYGKYL